MNNKLQFVVNIGIFFSMLISVFIFTGGNVLAKQSPSSKASLGGEVGKQLFAANKNAGLGSARDPRAIAASIIKVLLSFLGIVFLCIIVYAGYLWMTAGGNEEKVEESKKWMYRGVIGLFIILAAQGIVMAAIRIGLNYSKAPGTEVYVQPKYY